MAGGDPCGASSSGDGSAMATAASAAAAAGHLLVESATTDLSCGSRVLGEMAQESPPRAAKPPPHASGSPAALAARLKRRFTSALGSISSDGSKQDSVGHGGSPNQMSSSSMGTDTSGGATSDRISVASSRLFKRSRSSRSPRPSCTPGSSPESASTGALSMSSKAASHSSSRSILSTLLKRKSSRHSSSPVRANGDVDGVRAGSRTPSLSRRGAGGRARPSLAISAEEAKLAMRKNANRNGTPIVEDVITPAPVLRAGVAAASANEAAAAAAAAAAATDVAAVAATGAAAARLTHDASGSSVGSKRLEHSASRASGVSVLSEDEQPQYLEETDLGMTMVRIPDGEAPPPPGEPMPLSWQRLLFSLRGHVLTLHYMTPEDIVASADEPYLRDHEPLLESGQTSHDGAAAAGHGSQFMVSGSLVDDDNDYDDMSSDDPAAVGPRREPTLEQLSAGPPPPSPARRMRSGHRQHHRSGGSGVDMPIRQRAVSVVGSNVSSEAAGSAKAGSGSCFTDGATEEVSFHVQSGVSYANVSDVTMSVDVLAATFTLSGFPNLPPGKYALPDTRHAARWKAATQVAGRHSIGDFYVMGKVLGAGAFGKVYEAEDRHSHELHAVKVVTLSGADARRDERVRREVAIVCELRHPGIVRTYRVIKLQRHVYFAMEVMRGGDLFDYCSTFPNLSEDRIVHIARGILQSVAFLHSVGVVHRDLKPNNVLLKSKEWPIQLKLADFGLAAFMDPKRMTDEVFHAQLGTAYFMAPELLKHEAYGPAVDCFAVGMMICSIITGKLPFRGGDNAAYFHNVIIGKAHYPAALWKGVSPSAQSFVRGLLQNDPAKRLASLAALQHEFVLTEAPSTEIPRDRTCLHSDNRPLLARARAAVRAVAALERLKRIFVAALHELLRKVRLATARVRARVAHPFDEVAREAEIAAAEAANPPYEDEYTRAENEAEAAAAEAAAADATAEKASKRSDARQSEETQSAASSVVAGGRLSGTSSQKRAARADSNLSSATGSAGSGRGRPGGGAPAAPVAVAAAVPVSAPLQPSSHPRAVAVVVQSPVAASPAVANGVPAAPVSASQGAQRADAQGRGPSDGAETAAPSPQLPATQPSPQQSPPPPPAGDGGHVETATPTANGRVRTPPRQRPPRRPPRRPNVTAEAGAAVAAANAAAAAAAAADAEAATSAVAASKAAAARRAAREAAARAIELEAAEEREHETLWRTANPSSNVLHGVCTPPPLPPGGLAALVATMQSKAKRNGGGAVGAGGGGDYGSDGGDDGRGRGHDRDAVPSPQRATLTAKNLPAPSLTFAGSNASAGSRVTSQGRDSHGDRSADAGFDGDPPTHQS